MDDIKAPPKTEPKAAAGGPIERIETYCLELPYRKAVNFKSVSEAAGPFFLIKIITRDGVEGIADCVARPAQYGEDPRRLAHGIETYFKPMLIGEDPLDHNRLLAKMAKLKGLRTERALIDIALWDIKGKLLDQPVYRLLGGGPAEPIPVTWIVHGGPKSTMIDEAVAAVRGRGYRGLKIKVWRRSMEDIDMVRDIRREVGDQTLLYVDANSACSEGEARVLLSRLTDYNVAFIEDPCAFSDPRRMALMARALPIPLLGDACCGTLADVNLMIGLGAIGAANIKPRRSGITEFLKTVALCEAARIPVIIGTDSETRIGAHVRAHLRAAIPHLAPWPTETHFFEKLADDVFAGTFEFRDGTIAVPDTPGFGVGIDAAKLKKYSV